MSRASGNLTVVVWKYKGEVYMQSNIHTPPVQEKFIDNYGNAWKTQIVLDYNQNGVEKVGVSDRIVNSYSIMRKTLKWTKKLFFHLFNITVPNFYIINKEVRGNITQKEFREELIEPLFEAQVVTYTRRRMRSRILPSATTISILWKMNNMHWPVFSKGKYLKCRCCRKRRTSETCTSWDVYLCVGDCFRRYYT